MTAQPTPPTGKTPPAPPKVTGETKLDGKTICKLQAEKPCDVFQLKITTVSSTGVTRELVTTKRWHDIDPKYAAPNTAGMGRIQAGLAHVMAGLGYLVALLNRYDFIIETLGDAPQDDAARYLADLLGLAAIDSQPVKITAQSIHKQVCPFGTTNHPLLVFKTIYGVSDDDPKPRERHQAAYGPVEYHANPVVVPKPGTNSPFAAVLNFLTSLLAVGGAPKEVEVTACSCGKRDQGTPNEELRGMVRIYPRDEWGIMWVMPGYGTFESKAVDHKSAVLGGFAEDKFTEQKQLMRGGTVVTDTTSHTLNMQDGAGSVSDSRARSTGRLTGGIRTSRSDKVEETIGPWKGVITTHTSATSAGTRNITDPRRGRTIAERVDPAGIPAGQFAFKAFRNGVELKMVDRVLAIMDAVKKWADTVKDAAELLKRGPTIGWSASVSVGIFQGSITGTWGRTLDGMATERLLACKNTITLKFSITVLTFTMTIAFGFSWMPVTGAFETGIDARIGGDFNLAAKFELTVTDFSQQTAKFDGSAVPNLWIKFRASAAGYSVGATLNVGGGFTVTGTIDFIPGVKGDISGSFDALAITLTGKITSASKDLFAMQPKELLPGTNIGKFG